MSVAAPDTLQSVSPPRTAPASQRLASLDAYRGFIMVLMASGALSIPQVAKNLPDSGWVTVAPWFDHAPWVGGVLWDMIQPAFMFMVGTAAAFSTAKRLERGDTWGAILRHAGVRAVILIALGVLLASNWSKQTNWTFTNVLAQIGLGYFFLILLSRVSFVWQVSVGVALLVIYWAAFAFWPEAAPPDPTTIPWMQPHDVQTGFFAHWNPHGNAAAAFDRWFLNLFPRSEPYTYGSGGYQTLNFIPALVTMLMGLLCGERLRREGSSRKKLRDLIVAGVALTAVGLVLGLFVCPIVKRIWTPSWTFWSGGIVILMLAAFYAIIDIAGWKRWAMPLTVVGMNSIMVYLLYQLSGGWIRETLTRHLGSEWFAGPYGPMLSRLGVLVVIWLLCWWLWRQKVFLRI
jgi:predicted acyltransferase